MFMEMLVIFALEHPQSCGFHVFSIILCCDSNCFIITSQPQIVKVEIAQE